MAKQKANLVLVLLALIWGSMFIITKNILKVMSPFTLAALRFTIAAVILSIIFYKKLPLLLGRRIGAHCAVLGILNAAAALLQTAGLRFTSASNSAFITSLSVLLVPFLSAVIAGKRPRRSSAVGVVIAFAGLCLITGGPGTELNIGDLLTFFCAVSVAFYIVFVSVFVRDGEGLLLSVGQQIVSALVCIFVLMFFAEPVFGNAAFHPALIPGLLYIGGICTAFNNTVQVFVQKHVSPVSVALILLLEPVFALAFALFVRGPDGTVEVLTLGKAAGSLLIVLGAVFSELNLLDKILAAAGRFRGGKRNDKEEVFNEKMLK